MRCHRTREEWLNWWGWEGDGIDVGKSQTLWTSAENSNVHIKGVSLSPWTFKNSFVQGRHSCGDWRGIILISNLDYFISLRDCFLCGFPYTAVCGHHADERFTPLAESWGLFGSSGKQEAVEFAAEAAPSPPLSSQQARSSESGKEKQVGGERMHSTSVPGRD